MPSIHTNGIDIHYTEHGESGPTAVALHPATTSGSMLRWMVELLQEAGFRVITPDQRGHGQTDNPAPDMHLPRLVEDYEGFLQALDRLPVHGIGYSMGGGVTMHTARQHPEWFQSLVLLGTSYRVPSRERIDRVLGPKEERSAVVKRVFDPETGVHQGWNATADQFAHITAPTLIITADRDEFYDADQSLALYDAMPNAELLIVPNTDHLGLVNHELVVSAMRDFYSRL